MPPALLAIFPIASTNALGKTEIVCPAGSCSGSPWRCAFYKNSPLLVLDEATSALDTENEDRIHEAMKDLSKGKTTLLIAHRFSSIRLANRILVMNKGEIVADGPHDELYEKCDLYKNLYDRQRDQDS